jgi:hypothetical protein
MDIKITFEELCEKRRMKMKIRTQLKKKYEKILGYGKKGVNEAFRGTLKVKLFDAILEEVYWEKWIKYRSCF